MAGTYDKGDQIRCSVDFYSGTSLTDPTTIIFRLKTPAGTLVVYTYGIDVELAKLATGRYYVDVNIEETGVYFYRFEGSGVLRAASEDRFTIKDSEF